MLWAYFGGSNSEFMDYLMETPILDNFMKTNNNAFREIRKLSLCSGNSQLSLMIFNSKNFNT